MRKTFGNKIRPNSGAISSGETTGDVLQDMNGSAHEWGTMQSNGKNLESLNGWAPS